MAQTYFVECYWPGVTDARLADAVTHLTAENERDGAARRIDSTLIPADEIVLCVFEAPSALAVRTTAKRAGMPQERIVECIRVAPQRTNERSRDA